MKNNLLKLTICQMFIVIGISVSNVKCESKNSSAIPAENVTHFDRSFQKVLSRRKRFLLWRPGSNVLLTASLVKPLAFPRPGGHNLAIEWDIFYPLPSSWYKPTKPTKPAPKIEILKPAPEIIESWNPPGDHSDHSGEIWVPSGGWSPDSDVIKTLSEAETEGERRVWSAENNQVRSTDWNENNLFRSPSTSIVSQYQNPFISNNPWQQQPQTIRNGEMNFNQQDYQPNRRQSPSSYPGMNYIDDNQQRQMNFIPKGRSTRDLPENCDRRELYRRIETTSPLTSFDVKSCLLRTVCETQQFLLPRGYSLLQDMLRVVFTVPTRDLEDDYSSAMLTNDQDCANIYSEKCPVSILAFLLQSKL